MTWAVWKGCLPQLLQMSDDMVLAYVWDCLAFSASLSFLRHTLDAIKAWHRWLGLPVPMDGQGDHCSFTISLNRFQPTQWILKFPIHAGAVRRLLTLLLPAHPPCASVIPQRHRGRWTRCPVCWVFLHHWLNCLVGATGTLTCCRCLELGLLKTCYIWWLYDFLFCGWAWFREGAAYNIKIQNNDIFRRGHYPRVGVPSNGRFDLLGQR